ncbi:MAG TPA: GNAT family protein [Longimicrobiaceae bacterium]|nr:GNAT family protein [Longimicrobiaceae bacterium]
MTGEHAADAGVPMESPFLTGPTVYLRPHVAADVEGDWFQWFNDPEVNRFLHHGVFPNTRERQAAFLEELHGRHEARTHLQLAIVERATGDFVGVVSLGSIDWVHRNAELAMVMRSGSQSRGIGREVAALVLNHGFMKMNLHRIWACQHVGLSWASDGLKRYFGFREEGTLREAMRRDGEYHDLLVVGLLAREWRELLDGAGETLADVLPAAARPIGGRR